MVAMVLGRGILRCCIPLFASEVAWCAAGTSIPRRLPTPLAVRVRPRELALHRHRDIGVCSGILSGALHALAGRQLLGDG